MIRRKLGEANAGPSAAATICALAGSCESARSRGVVEREEHATSAAEITTLAYVDTLSL
jgi:hypothetical protein